MWCGQRLLVADLVCYWRFSTEKKWIMVCRLFSMSRSHVYRDHLNTATSCQASVPGILFRESCDMLLTVIVFECSVLLPPKNIYASWHGDLCEVGVFDFRLVTCLWFLEDEGSRWILVCVWYAISMRVRIKSSFNLMFWTCRWREGEILIRHRSESPPH